MPAPRVDVEFRDEFAIFRMKNGENRFNLLSLAAINEALDEVERSKETKFLVTTGDGKFYSNGIDLEWLNGCDSHEDTTKFIRGFNELLIRMMTFPMPTVAALNGHAFAGGALFMFAHDYRVMRTQKGWVCFPEIDLNLRFGPGMLLLIRERVRDSQILTDMILMGKRFTAEECLDAGLVDEICDLDVLIKRAVLIGRKALKGKVFSRDMMCAMKEDLYQHVIDSFMLQNTTHSSGVNKFGKSKTERSKL